VNDPYTFLDNKTVKQIDTAIEKDLSLTVIGGKLLTAYAASLLLHRNGQQCGVVENMTIKEFENSTSRGYLIEGSL